MPAGNVVQSRPSRGSLPGKLIEYRGGMADSLDKMAPVPIEPRSPLGQTSTNRVPATGLSGQQPRFRPGVVPLGLAGIGVLGCAWLCLLTVLYAQDAASVLSADGFLGARQTLPTV